jgi:hypothetical protein
MNRKRRHAGILVIGICALVGFGAVAGVRAASLGAGSPRPVPGHFRESLSAGRWEFYELTGITRGGSAGPFSYNVTHGRSPVLGAAAISVTAPGGQPVAVHGQPGNTTETIQRGADIYTGVAGFDAQRSGRYAITVSSAGPGRVILARPVLSQLLALLPWAGGSLAGAVCIALGLILLTLGNRRRAGPRPAGPVPPRPAPGPGSRG